MHCTFEVLTHATSVAAESMLGLPSFFGRVGPNSLSPNPLTETSKKTMNFVEVLFWSSPTDKKRLYTELR